MANAKTEIIRIEFILLENETICNLYYVSSEPGTPWGGGWKHKRFPASVNICDFLNAEIPNYLDWSKGKDFGED